jgi:S-adenosyl methyltransferase
MTDEPAEPDARAGVDTATPHPAPAGADPAATAVARGSRAFLGRTVRWLAADAGVRQFLDVGAGPPSAGGTHEVARRVAPDALTVCVDHDPLVLAQAGAGPAGAHYVEADMHDPAGIVCGARQVLDLHRPVAVLFVGVLGHIGDLDDARDLVRYLVDRTCPGSYLVVGEGTHALAPATARPGRAVHRGPVPYVTREPVEIESFFEGLEFVGPGLVPVSRWRPDTADDGADDRGSPPVDAFGGVGRKR